MPYFAHVLEGIVRKVERIDKSVMVDPDGNESESLGQAFLAGIYPDTDPAEYILTHYPVGQPDPYPRGQYAGIGDTWDGTRFSTPEPSP